MGECRGIFFKMEAAHLKAISLYLQFYGFGRPSCNFAKPLIDFYGFGRSSLVESVKNGKAIMVNEFYSMTTSKHQSKYREMFSLDRDKGELFEYGAFIKRAELDGVNVLGGWNN